MVQFFIIPYMSLCPLRAEPARFLTDTKFDIESHKHFNIFEAVKEFGAQA